MQKYVSYKERPAKIPVFAKILGVVLCLSIILITGINVYVNTFLTYYPVSGQSMADTLNANGINEDYVYVSSNKNIDYGDIFVYEREAQIPNTTSNLVIKRLIAKGDDSIGFYRYQDNNGVNQYTMVIKYAGKDKWSIYNEKYVEDKTSYTNLMEDFVESNPLKTNTINYETAVIDGESRYITYITIPTQDIFYLGDNREYNISYDCADYGSMPIDKIVGKVEFIIYKGSNNIFQIIKQLLGMKEWL